MSLWRRAPRQVYRVYGEDEYLAEEHVAADTEFLGEAEDPRSYESGSEIRTAAHPTGSRTSRLVGVGLLLGVTVGAAGLVLSHLSHETSPPRVSLPGPSVLHHMSGASSRSVSQHTFGKRAADAEANLPNRTWARRASAPPYAMSGSTASRRIPKSVTPADRSRLSEQSPPARMSEPLSSAAASVSAEEIASFAASGGEFEFER